MNIDDQVRVIDIDAVNSDVLLDTTALSIIQRSKYRGTITKIVDDVYFVGFRNEYGWVTQGYHSSEIEVI